MLATKLMFLLSCWLHFWLWNLLLFLPHNFVQYYSTPNSLVPSICFLISLPAIQAVRSSCFTSLVLEEFQTILGKGSLVMLWCLKMNWVNIYIGSLCHVFQQFCPLYSYAQMRSFPFFSSSHLSPLLFERHSLFLNLRTLLLPL